MRPTPSSQSGGPVNPARVDKADAPEDIDASLSRIDQLTADYIESEQWKKAEEQLKRAVDTRKRSFGPDHNDTLNSRSNLAGVLDKQGRYEEAGEMESQTLGTRHDVLAKSTNSTIDTMDNLATLYQHADKLEDAEMMRRQTLELRRKWVGNSDRMQL